MLDDIKDILNSLPEDKRKRLEEFFTSNGYVDESKISMNIELRVFDEDGDLKQEETVECVS